MHRLLSILLLASILSGCATVSIAPVVKKKTDRPYRFVMTLVVEQRNMDLYRFDAQTYQEYIQPQFNNLANLQYRQQLEHSLKRNLNAKHSRVIASSVLFPVNEPVSYEAFAGKLDSLGIEAVLLINLNRYWFSENRNYDASSGIVREDEQPNASFLCYLIDWQSGQLMWIAQSTVNGIWAGYDTLNNHLSRKVAARLRSERYLFQPSYGQN